MRGTWRPNDSFTLPAPFSENADGAAPDLDACVPPKKKPVPRGPAACERPEPSVRLTQATPVPTANPW